MYDSYEEEHRKLLKNILKLIAIGFTIILGVILIFNSVYTSNEQEKVIVTTFGKPTAVQGAGLHFKIPFVQQTRKVNTTVNKLAIGYQEDDNSSIPSATMITGDFNFVNADFYLAYEVVDPIKAVYNSSEPIKILLNITQSAAREVIGNTSVDDILTTGKTEAQAKIVESIEKQLESYDIGIRVRDFTIQDVEPPIAEVIAAFKSVEEAKTMKETDINNANAFKNETIPNARATADQLIRSSEAQKQERINEANGAVARFNETFAEYVKNKEITKQRLFYEAMESIVPGMKVIITDDNGNTNQILPLMPLN